MAATGTFLLKNDINAALVAFGCVMLSFVGIPGEILAAIVISLVTLQKGMKSGSLVVAFVALPAVGFLLHKEISVFDLVFLQCLFVWGFAGLMRRYHSWRIVLESMVILSLILVGLMHLLVPDPAVFWTTLFNAILVKFSASMGGATAVDTSAMTAHIRAVAPYVTGVMLLSLMGIMFIELLIATVWSSRLSAKSKTIYQAFINIRVGYLNSAILVLVLAGLLFHMAYARDCFFAVLLPFVIGGLSYLHYSAKRYRQLLILLGLLYIGLFLTSFSVKILIALALIGFVDSLFNIRKRFAF